MMTIRSFCLAYGLVASLRLVQLDESPNRQEPQPGEFVVQDSLLTLPGTKLELLGVCKVQEEGMSCWRPNGRTDEQLAIELKDALKTKDPQERRDFQLRFGKKNRILVLKRTNQIRTNEPILIPYIPRSDDTSDNYWRIGYSAPLLGDENKTQQGQSDLLTMFGSFDANETSVPMRFQSNTNGPRPSPIPFAIGEFSVGLNSYRITAISGKSVNNYYGGSQAEKFPRVTTHFTLEAVNIRDRNSIITFSPADADGLPYIAYNAKHELMNSNQYSKQIGDWTERWNEAVKKGNTSNRILQQNYFPSMITPMVVDNADMTRKGKYEGILDVSLSKVKKISFSVQKRTVYIFDSIKLDPN